MKKKITTPVLLLAFNKPDKTKQVFDVIRQVKPVKLYVAVDGPRSDRPSDTLLCQQVREIVSDVDWECETHYLFHEENVGCSLGGKTAWDWFFSQEEEMIFLEDDGVASLSFFWFCQELLEKYRHDERIAYIGGVNYGITKGDASYFFTRSGSGSYGMASWKRVYKLYEYKLGSFDKVAYTKDFKASFVSPLAYKIRMSQFIKYIKYGGNTYDIQSLYLLHKHNMWCIVPNINMVTDIGYDFDGTNNNAAPDSPIAKKYGNRPRFELEELVHPQEFSIDRNFEDVYFRERYLQGKSWPAIWFKLILKPAFLSFPLIRGLYRFSKQLTKALS